MEGFTFDDFVSVLGGSCTNDPAEVVEAWEEFQQAGADYFGLSTEEEDNA